jgi:type II secretory pathway component PulJ
MNESKAHSSISALAALLLLAVFAVGIFAVLISGATDYKSITARDSESYNQRTCMQYISTKLRQAANGQAVELAQFGDGAALLIHQQFSGKDYVNRIYCSDGYLMELFSAADGDFAPEDGEPLLELESMDIKQDGGLLSFELVDANGSTISFKLALRGESEAGT